MTLGRLLDPQNYMAFTRIFGNERNKDILIHFLNDIFARTTNPIEEVTFLKTIQNLDTVGQRVSSIDIVCEERNGEKFIVEMKVANYPGFERSAQNYAVGAYINQHEQDFFYQGIKKIIFLAIVNFVVFPDKPDYISHGVTLENQIWGNILNHFSFSFIELPKFNLLKGDLKTIVQRWCYFFKYASEIEKEDLKEIIGPEFILRRAYEELDPFSWSRAELFDYNSVEMKLGADKAIREAAFNEDKARSKDQVEKEKKEFARKMLEKGINIKAIASLTNLSMEEIEKLAY